MRTKEPAHHAIWIREKPDGVPPAERVLNRLVLVDPPATGPGRRGQRARDLPAWAVQLLGTHGASPWDLRPLRLIPRDRHHRRVFIAEQVRVQLPLPTATVRLVNLTRGNGLAGASHRAYRDGTEALLRVGPLGDVPGLAKLVRVLFLDPVWSEHGVTVGVRWEASGSTQALFPVLDANLVLSPASRRTCTLACAAVYRPPLGRLGAALDQAVMSHVATATIRSLLQQLAAEMVNPAAAPSLRATGDVVAQLVIAPEELS